MTTITLPRALLEQALGALEASGCLAFKDVMCRCSQECRSYTAAKVLKAALAQEQAEPVEEPVDVGLLEYRGNSVAFIHQKMTAYRTGIDAAWDAFRANGLHPDGKTSLADMIAKYTAPPKAEPVQKPVIDRNLVLQAIDDLNMVDDVLEAHWVEHDVGTGRVNEVLCSLLKAIDFAAPPKAEPLTDEEIMDAFHAARNAKLGASQDNSKHRLSVVEIARAIERKLEEKNRGR